jgi:hypothetical protein
MAWQHILISRFGGPEVLELAEEQSIPDPGHGEVRIKVLPAGTVTDLHRLPSAGFPAHPSTASHSVGLRGAL